VAIQDLPEGVTLLDPRTNEIEVRVSIGTSGGTANVIPSMPVQLVNAPANMDVTVDPATVDIDISAASDILASLTPEDIRVTVDLAGLGPGVYTLTPSVDVPNDIDVIEINPSRVVVLISDRAATPVDASAPGVD
jgi:YbbR domain-containing protein